MNIKHAILVISIYGCGFAKLESKGYTGYKSKEISSSSHDDPIDESLASADDLQSTEVGNGRKLDLPNSGDLGHNSDAIAKKIPESTEIGNGQKPDIIPGTINIDSEQANAQIESSIVTGAFLSLCVLSSKRINCRVNGENNWKRDIENLKVYDLTHNEIPPEDVSYKVFDENLEILISDEVEIGSIEIDQQDVDLSMRCRAG